MSPPLRAILLLGPTGSGKSPLGDYLEQHGLAGRRCAHFDFGAQLRAAAVTAPSELMADDLAVIRHCLATDALLEDSQFSIAAKILHAFAAQRQLTADDRIILNGLPRHAGQARDIDAIVAITAVISLDCSPQVVLDRIRLNTGGDRAGRSDDDLPAIARKLDWFHQRTRPLIEHYRARGVPVVSIPITVNTTPAEIVTEEVISDR